MLLLLFPTKIIPPPCTQGLSRGFAVYDTSAVLECKDSDNYWNKEEITDIFLIMSGTKSLTYSLISQVC